MLPPSGSGPIEVTREVLEAEQVSKAQPAPAAEAAPEPAAVLPAQPAEPVPAPAAERTAIVPGELPPDTAPAAEILSACEQIILAVRMEAEERLREVESAWISKAGPAVRLVHRTKAYKDMTDASGKPYRSFQRWAQERCGISRPHAYRMVSEGPVADALAPFSHIGPLTTRQVDVLAPILRQHGEDAVRRVWSAAESTGGTSAKQLEVKRDVLGLGTNPEDYEPVRELAAVTPVAALAQVQKAVVSSDRAVLKEAAMASPNAARQTMLAALKLASDLQAVLNELGETQA
jgi:hypothetical protein